MPSLAEFAKGFNAAGYSSNSSTRSPKISDSISKYFDSVSYSGKQNINPVPKPLPKVIPKTIYLFLKFLYHSPNANKFASFSKITFKLYSLTK